MAVRFSSDIIHLFANLLKTVNGTCKVMEGIIGIIFNSHVSKIRKSCIDGTANSLFHRLGVVGTKFAAQFGYGKFARFRSLFNHIIDQRDNIRTAAFTDDAQLLQDRTQPFDMRLFFCRLLRSKANFRNRCSCGIRRCVF